MRENSRWEFLIPSYTIKTSHFDAKTHATFTFHIDLGRVTIFFFLFFLFKVTIKLFNYCKNKKIVKLLIFLVFFFFSLSWRAALPQLRFVGRWDYSRPIFCFLLDNVKWNRVWIPERPPCPAFVLLSTKLIKKIKKSKLRKKKERGEYNLVQ